MNDTALIEQDQLPLEQPRGRALLSAADVRHQVNVIQEVMAAVMKPETHYGRIPGTPKPTLYKAGSEVLLTTFRIGAEPEVEDLSTDDVVRYRVRLRGFHIPTGQVVGYGIGECSSNEEKYKWRKAPRAEWDAADENRRRIKYYGDKRALQVRGEPADVANTVLKMAKKRAQIDLCLTATGASDMFTQDVEDMPPGYETDDRQQAETQPEPQYRAPQSRSAKPAAAPAQADSAPKQDKPAAGTGAKVGENHLRVIRGKLKGAPITENHVAEHFGVKAVDELTVDQLNPALSWITEQCNG